jgi:adenylate cyclase, class 2
MTPLNAGKIEVEIKAWVDNRSELKKKVEKIAGLREELVEQDLYFTFANTKGYQKQRFRLRQVGGKSIVTVKIPGVSDLGVEANREFEFEVSDPEAFKVFCKEFAMRVLIEKHKKVKSYTFKPGQNEFPFPVTIELNSVRDLGDFIELETLVEKDEMVGRAAAFLRSLLDRLSVPRSKIEPRAYTELLYKKSNS